MENRVSLIWSNIFNTIFLASEFCGALLSIVRTANLPNSEKIIYLTTVKKVSRLFRSCAKGNGLPVDWESFPEKRGQTLGCFPSKGYPSF